jgi:hypothetical protein
MSYAGLEALAGRGGTSPAKASSPALVFSLSTIHYPLSTIHYPLSTIHYPLFKVTYPNRYFPTRFAIE